MSNIKNYNTFILESYGADGRAKMFKLITDNGEVLDIHGYAEEGFGIFDFDGNQYPAGIAHDGTLYADSVDVDNSIFKIGEDGHVPNFKFGDKSFLTESSSNIVPMKIELKNIKYSEKLSNGSNCFSADIYIDGKKVGYTENRGRGGSTSYHSYEGNRDILNKADEYCKTLPPISYDDDFSVDNNLENTIDVLFEDWLNAKEDAKENKRLQKKFEKGIYYKTTGGEYILSGWKKYDLAQMLAIPAGRDVVKKTIKDIEANGGTIMNTNLPKDLF